MNECECVVWEEFQGTFMCFDPECPRQIDYLTKLCIANNQPIDKQEELEIERLLNAL